MSAEEVRAALLGHEIGGQHPDGGGLWRECIGRDGATAYWHAQRQQRGRLRVTREGQACFSYDRDGFRAQHCFTVLRDGERDGKRAGADRLILHHVGDGQRFVVEGVRPVSSCDAREAVS